MGSTDFGYGSASFSYTAVLSKDYFYCQCGFKPCPTAELILQSPRAVCTSAEDTQCGLGRGSFCTNYGAVLIVFKAENGIHLVSFESSDGNLGQGTPVSFLVYPPSSWWSS